MAQEKPWVIPVNHDEYTSIFLKVLVAIYHWMGVRLTTIHQIGNISLVASGI